MCLFMNKKDKKDKKDVIISDGQVIEVLGGTTFKVKLDDNGYEVLCKPSGKLRMNSIMILLYDYVTIEMSVYNLENGRIIKRK